MSEANRTRWGGGLPTVRDAVILSEAKELSLSKVKELGPPPRLQTLASLGLDPPLLSRRGVFDGKIIFIFNILIFN
jgi:hypothetical protein